MFATRYALVIGIDGNGLSGAVNDAVSMGFHLESPLGGGFGRVDYLFNEQATPRAIGEHLEAAAQVRREAVLVYYAGHSDRAFLQTSRRDLPLALLADWVEYIPAAHRSVVLDSCESGGFIDQFGAVGGAGDIEPAPPAFIHALHRAHPAVRIVTATNRREDAIEVGGRGAFTNWLLAASRFATPDLPGGAVSLGRALQFARSNLVRLGFSRPCGFGPLGDFPFAVSDLGRSFGHVAVGGRRAASAAWNGPAVSVSLDVRGRKRLLTKVEHHVCDARGVTMSTTSADHWPEAAHDVPTLWLQVPPWASTVPGAVSWVVVKDDRGRPLAQNVAPLPHLNRPMTLVL